MRCAVRMWYVSGVWFINFTWTWGEQRTPDAWKEHPAHPVFFMFAQKTNKFWFAVNGIMWIVCGWCSAGSESHPHIRAFGLRTICEWFANHLARLCIRGFRSTRLRKISIISKSASNKSCTEINFLKRNSEDAYLRLLQEWNGTFSEKIWRFG